MSEVDTAPVVPIAAVPAVESALPPNPPTITETKVVKPRESIRKSLLLIKEEIDPKIAPGEHIMEIKVKEPKAPVVPVVVEVREVKPRESIRKSLLLIKEEIDPKIAPGEHIMEIKVKEPKSPVAVAPVIVEVKEVKPRESIRKSLLLIKEEIDPKIAPGEHIMEIKVKEPKAPVVPVVVEVKEVKPRESIRASLILMKKDIDPSVAPGEHIMEVKVKEPPSSISSLSVSPAATLSTTKACDSAPADPLSGTSASTITSAVTGAVTGAGVSQPAGATTVIKIDGTPSPDNTSITTSTTTSSSAVIVDAKPAPLDATVAPTEPSTGVMDWMKNLF